MKWMGLNEIRESFLHFFEEKGHTRLPSFPLVPINDNSLLLINSGMAPMKKFFLGQETPPNKRVTTCQKCIRTPDIENVGKTARHGTFFEMLGNFSFGDYFKREVTAWAWEFLTGELELPADRLWITIYEEDDEAFEIWTREVGIPPERIIRMGKEDNFWEIGSGPCGPCSEIHWDRGEEYGCHRPTCGVGCDCDRYMEIWNLVFSQFDSDGEGHYERLAHPNIDTGMGLERLACVIQNVGNLFEVDTVQNIMKHVSSISGVPYHQDAQKDISLRVITDHIRSTTFMISDGVLPSNEGRGYVLRRLLRRGARHGRLLGITEPFLYQVCETVIQENEGAYPELRQHADFIKKVIRVEEERFAKTIDQGMELLNSIIDRIDAAQFGERRLSGEEAFKLYDTFGFPIDLTREIIAERNIELDEDVFRELMERQRQTARSNRNSLDTVSWSDDSFADLDIESFSFLGYDSLEAPAVIRGILRDSERVENIGQGEAAVVVLSETPFYAESGGQVGDRGVIVSGKSIFKVEDCKKSPTGQYLHIGQVVSGIISAGAQVQAVVDKDFRRAVMRNHSACHLLQAALRRVLGDHVHQAGSYVDPHRCRFDFSHFSAMTPQEMKKTEKLVNEMILEALPVQVREMPLEEAKKVGAMALFGEKYGDIVRVCDMSGRSVEFCGGTHVSNTAQIGLFRIISESSVGAGVRRIEATTALGVLELLEQSERVIGESAMNLKLANPADLVAKTASVAAELKAKDREIETLTGKMAEMQTSGLFENAMEVCGVKVVYTAFSGTKNETLRAMCDRVKDQMPKMVAMICGMNEGKSTLFAVCGKEAVAAGVHAGKLMKEVSAMVGGSGGGRPDSAMGGAKDVFKIDEALAKVPQIVQRMVEEKQSSK